MRLVVAIAACTLLACETPPAPPTPLSGTAAMYPTLVELYENDHGIYTSCGPNNMVCHNSRQYPNLSTLESIVQHIDEPCNQLRDDPEDIHDLCEPQGDELWVDEQRVQIAYLEPIDAGSTPRRWRMKLAGPPPQGLPQAELFVVRGSETVYRLSDYGVRGSADPDVDSALLLQLPGEEEALDDFDGGALMSAVLAKAGVSGAASNIRVGDPNRNGTFGYGLGGRLIKPGDPARSYLFRRLVDPSAGPLMPLANCCSWTKASLRALWCWVSGLEEDGGNALAPIDYASCPPGPVEAVDYPAPGPACDEAGMCPVQARVAASDEPTFSNVYDNIIRQRCAGSDCHFDRAAGGLDLSSRDVAHGALLARVVAGNAGESSLYKRLNTNCAPDTSCSRMPLGLDPLPGNELAVIAAWIEAGAPDD